jgi:hypothetical protein
LYKHIATFAQLQTIPNQTARNPCRLIWKFEMEAATYFLATYLVAWVVERIASRRDYLDLWFLRARGLAAITRYRLDLW